jgi:6-phosphogluconolactonase
VTVVHDVRKYADLESVTRAFADELVRVVPMIVQLQGRCSIALSGGSTPRRLFQMLAELPKDALPWDSIDLYWGDERTVGPDDPDSNYGMAKRELIDKLKLDEKRIHRIRGEESDPKVAVKAYLEELAQLAPTGGIPIFDYVILGMGSDGHTASLFPDSPALDEVTEWFVANAVDSPLCKGKTIRLTLTAGTINWARRIRFLISGADKAEALREVLDGPIDPKRYPSQLIRPKDGTLVWLVDEAAAGKLEGARRDPRW